MEAPTKARVFSFEAWQAVPVRVTSLSRVPAVMALTMCAGCLVTDPPQFKPAQHTAPFLVEASADPDPRQVVVVDTQLLNTTSAVKAFSADVISQDDPADSTGSFRQVSSRLYIDYGYSNEAVPDQPFLYALGGKTLPPGGSLDVTTGRRVSAQWSPAVARVDPGCHTVTLVASHVFDDAPGCPTCSDDYSTITWQILRCDSSKLGDCDTLPVTGVASCAGLTNSCEKARPKDAGSSCPDDSDGGTQ